MPHRAAADQKVEQCAYLQMLDSIYLDMPMERVKMGAEQEYEYVANYRIMQNIFKAKKIDKPIPVEKLINSGTRTTAANRATPSGGATAPVEPSATLAPARPLPASPPPPARFPGADGAARAQRACGGPEKERDFCFEAVRLLAWCSRHRPCRVPSIHRPSRVQYIAPITWRAGVRTASVRHPRPPPLRHHVQIPSPFV
ncbi:EB1 protein [Mycena latifolia]|nr:EB1 protein [Mycena latifolia]